MICISKYDAGTNYEWHNTLYLLYPAININYVWLIVNIPLSTVIFFTICAILYIIFCTFLCMYDCMHGGVCVCVHVCTYVLVYVICFCTYGVVCYVMGGGGGGVG